MHYLEISKAVVKKLGGKFFVRLVCTVNRKVKYQCGLMGKGGGVGYITITKARMRELGVHADARVTVRLELDKSKYGLEMPEELKELLRQDREGKRRFELLSKGKQRNILHYVGNVKDSDKRIQRAIFIIDNLKDMPEGKETARGLFKSSGEFNRQG